MRPDQLPIAQKVAVVLRAQTGELAAFGELVGLYRRRVMGTISQLIARPEDVEDVAQEVFLRVHKIPPQIQKLEAFEVWSHKLTMSSVYDYLRRRQPRRPEIRMSDLMEEQMDAALESSSVQWLRDEEQRRRTVEYFDDLLAQLSASDRILMVRVRWKV
jgi:RNA polymerase sigma-70 factor (ECF subfamily)